MADEHAKTISVTRGKIAVHISIGFDIAPELLKALTQSKMKDDDAIKTIRHRLAPLIAQKEEEPA